MKIYSLIITDTKTGTAPIYEVHTWDKAEEIIKKTMELTNDEFTFKVVGRVVAREQGE